MGIEEWQHLILSSLLAPPPNWFSVYLQSFISSHYASDSQTQGDFVY